MSEFLIHACPAREWYVEDYLIPSMVEQGIPREKIEVWMDRDGDGNLRSFVKSCIECGKRGGGRWHMQDDVAIAADFRERTEKYDDGIVTGFFRHEWQTLTPKSGYVPAVYMWNSFQCIRIPDDIAGEFAEWFLTDACFRETYKERLATGKCDDSFFADFIYETHTADWLTNLTPALVEHVDFLLGGSVINQSRGSEARAAEWADESIIDNLRDKLARR